MPSWLLPLLQALGVVVASAAGMLAWVAKLRWSKEYRAATEQLIRAKDAEIAHLEQHVSMLEGLDSVKLRERYKGDEGRT